MGHFYARDAFGNRIKLYICLFVCATTRAAHLEVVDNLSATSFILCLRRLAAAKGIPSTIISDNHKMFISGEKFLLDLQEDDIIKEFLQDHRIKWRHQTPRSPWMGGHFERLVRTIKTSLSAAITRKLYNREEFTTTVKEIESIVNARPLTYQSNDTGDQPLTPSQLLWGRDLSIMPPLLQPNTDEDSTTEAKELRHQYFLLSNALDRFRKHWSTEYLTSLREKHMNHCAEMPTHHLKPGSLVMVRHDNMHRYEWPLGKVVRVFPDPQGVIRTAEVEEGGRSSIRSVTFLVPLELDCYDDEEGDIPETEAAGDYQEAPYSEAGKPPASVESILSGHEGPILLGIDSPSSGPPKSPQASSADMHLSSLDGTHSDKSADIPKRDSESPPPRRSVRASSNIPTELRVAVSRQPPTHSRESAPLSTAQSEEPTRQRQPRRAATHERQLLQELLQQDLL